jgi:hypothetical protein
MFANCTSLNYIKMLATDISANYCLSNWVSNVSKFGIFIKNKNTRIPYSVGGIPENWKLIEEIEYPSIINTSSDMITLYYEDGLFTPTSESFNLLRNYLNSEIMSFKPEQDITISILNSYGDVINSRYVWSQDLTLNKILQELNIPDISNIIIMINGFTNIIIPDTYYNNY